MYQQARISISLTKDVWHGELIEYDLYLPIDQGIYQQCKNIMSTRNWWRIQLPQASVAFKAVPYQRTTAQGAVPLLLLVGHVFYSLYFLVLLFLFVFPRCDTACLMRIRRTVRHTHSKLYFVHIVMLLSISFLFAFSTFPLLSTLYNVSTRITHCVTIMQCFKHIDEARRH